MNEMGHRGWALLTTTIEEVLDNRKEKAMQVEKKIAALTQEEELRCFLCEEAKPTVRCALCQVPVCTEHQQEVQEYVTKRKMIFCEECADYYEGFVQPD